MTAARGSSPERARRIAAAGLLLVLAVLPGCRDAAPESVSRALVELERLAFVPPGRCRLEGYAAPNDFVVERALVVDLYEVTRADRALWLEGAEPSPGARNDWPAAMTFEDARDVAERRGMRLLTPAEWIYCAAGPRAHKRPWGESPRSSVANTLELALGQPTAVGTFEMGRGPFGHYDLVGNVWEWVDGSVRGRGDSASRSGDSVSAMGGSWLYRAAPTYTLADGGGPDPVFNALSLAPGTLALDVGTRCAADARHYLREHAAAWGTGERVRSRVRAVGRRFGSDALPLLEELAREPGAPPALTWLAEGAGS